MKLNYAEPLSNFAFSFNLRRYTADHLEEARMSFGTDEDLLLVRVAALDQRKVQGAVQTARSGGGHGC